MKEIFWEKGKTLAAWLSIQYSHVERGPVTIEKKNCVFNFAAEQTTAEKITQRAAVCPPSNIFVCLLYAFKLVNKISTTILSLWIYHETQKFQRKNTVSTVLTSLPISPMYPK